MLRRHQRLALDALAAARATGRRRGWVVLPPGAGKTLVGLEAARQRLGDGAVDRVVVLGPNTAIQAQWIDSAAAEGLAVGAERSLASPVSVLTYQAVAVFDADVEVADDPSLPTDPSPTDGDALLDRLHPNGRALVASLQGAGRVLLVLDECHHLLEVWGRLLAELLDALPHAEVLGLTATPPEALTADQAALVDQLFGEVVLAASIPAVVREGDLAPFAELAWLTTPSAHEQEWLAAEATRFTELVAQLTDPTFGSISFLSWLDLRFVAPVPVEVSWAALVAEEPALCRAALRMHHAGLLALPPGARPVEEHRRAPGPDDWVALAEDWLLRHVVRTGEPDDERVVAAVRRALPAVGFQWTRRGIRRGRSTVDRVLARSEAKTVATVQIVAEEHRTTGDRTRVLVLCDHEEATATLPVDLEGVIDRQAGSAVAVLEALLADAGTAALDPLLVTGRTLAGAPRTLAALVRHVAARDADLAGRLVVEDPPAGARAARLTGPWTSRTWVRDVTGLFEAGGCRVLVGTRGLLGEGWDARRISALVDLTAATTLTAVVQTRGRALRVDPSWPDKVAVTWSVVCVSEEHPRGGNDWDRLVRKHTGFHGVDDDGDVVDGVAHLDPAFSPFAPPAAAAFDAVNARMLERAARRWEVRDRWRVGEPYDDRVVQALRVLPARPAPSHALSPVPAPASLPGPPSATGALPGGPAVVPRAEGLEVRQAPPLDLAAADRWRWSGRLLAAAMLAVGVIALVLGLGPVAVGLLVLAAGAAAGAALRRAGRLRRGELAAYRRAVLLEASRGPTVDQVARAVADALHRTGDLSRGAEAVTAEVDREGEYRCVLGGVAEPESALFVQALDEALAPVTAPRYLLPRHVLVAPVERRGTPSSREELDRELAGQLPDGTVWHPVPTVLGVRAERARVYADAWDRWVGGGAPLWTGSPEGAGVLAAQRGSDPFAVTTVVRRHWS